MLKILCINIRLFTEQCIISLHQAMQKRLEWIQLNVSIFQSSIKFPLY